VGVKMNEIIICECGNKNFYLLYDKSRCQKCHTEYKYNDVSGKLFSRKFNLDKNIYEHYIEVKK
jgi:hypothetical protein